LSPDGAGPRSEAQQPLEALATVLRGSAVPYGYTLTVLSSHSILAHTHGGPTTFQVLLFVVGAVVAFATLGLLTQRFSPRPMQPGRSDMIRAGMVHVFAIGAAFGATVLVAQIPGLLAWPLGAYAATSLYMSITSLEIDFAHRLDGD
jgi:hypothetical protein